MTVKSKTAQVAKNIQKARKEQRAQFKRQFDNNYKGHSGNPNNMPSMTIPDMNLTLKELLYNHTRGISSDVHNYEPQYFEEDIPTIMDLNDLTELKLKNEQLKSKLEEQVQTERANQKTQQPDKDTEAPKTKRTDISETEPKTDRTIPEIQ